MATITLTVDDQILERARRHAEQEGTSVDAILVRYLGEYAAATGQSGGAFQAFLERTEDWKTGSGPEGRTWKRSDLHDRD